MNKPLSLFLRAFGFNRPAPATRTARQLRRLERAAYVLTMVYVCLQVFPQVLFAHSVTTQGITLYSRVPLPAEAAACATRAAELLCRSELAVSDRHERIFICDSPWVFRLFGPMNAQSFAFSVPLTDHVFVADADFPRDIAHSSAPDHNVRSLSAVMAHEITHGLIRRRLGLVRGGLLPTWVAEGYCDYIAQEGSFPAAEGLRLMAADQSDPSMSFRYFKYRQMVSYLMDVRHCSFAQVATHAGDAATVETETRQALQPRPVQ